MADIKLVTILMLLELKGLGPSLINKHAKIIFESCDKGTDIEDLLPLITKKEFTQEEIEEAKRRAALTIETSLKNNIIITPFYDENFPRALENYKSKIAVLYSTGDFHFSKTIGIIGSRKARSVASKIAERLGLFCFENKLNIVSGIAEGIDMKSIYGIEHKSNIIGVLPGGLAIGEYKTLKGVYENNAKCILSDGGNLISQFTPFEKQNQFSVVKYCILQAAIADSLVLVQSSLDGGSRFTVEHFCQQEKTLFVVNALEHDSAEEEYAANKLIIEKKQAGIAEWCKIKPEKIKCKIEVINSKEDYQKILSLTNTKNNKQTLF
jgi:DNA processing protein